MSHNYNPKVRLFYGTVGESGSRITPAPTFSVATELEYSNDTIIGYKYVITLNGQITAIDLSDGNSSGEFGVGSIIDHAHQIRKILSENGNILTVTDNYNEERPILKAKGGILRSFDISDSPNNWTHYANYSATIEFQSVEFIGASWRNYTSEDCSNIFLSDNTYTLSNPGILDISKYKIKSFEDSWSFNFNENDSYDFAQINGNYIDNTGFTIEYSINATGKNAYVYTDEDTSEVKIVPGWEQAKNFVQYRLHHQVNGLINGVLNNSQGDACSPTGSLSNLTEPNDPGILNGFDASFEIFNETVNCDVSESDGSYSVSYSAIVKKRDDTLYSTTNTRHRVSKSIKTNISNGSTVTNIVINGNIEGLIPGGLIKSYPLIRLPEKGSFFVHQQEPQNTKNLSNAKYTNANSLLPKLIILNNDPDLTTAFKSILGISYSDPISVNLTHDRINGTINYSVEYSSNRECGRQQTTTTIQTDASVPVFARFDIPNSGTGPFYQSLATKTAQKVTVTVQGSSTQQCNNILGNIFSGGSRPSVPVTINGLLIDSKYTQNLKDGSYTLVKTYIDSQGCAAF